MAQSSPVAFNDSPRTYQSCCRCTCIILGGVGNQPQVRELGGEAGGIEALASADRHPARLT